MKKLEFLRQCDCYFYFGLVWRRSNSIETKIKQNIFGRAALPTNVEPLRHIRQRLNRRWIDKFFFVSYSNFLLNILCAFSWWPVVWFGQWKTCKFSVKCVSGRFYRFDYYILYVYMKRVWPRIFCHGPYPQMPSLHRWNFQIHSVCARVRSVRLFVRLVCS